MKKYLILLILALLPGGCATQEPKPEHVHYAPNREDTNFFNNGWLNPRDMDRDPTMPE